MSLLEKLPLHFTIQRPGAIPRGVGIESTKGPHGVWLQARGLAYEKRLGQIAAEMCGITYSEFLRRSLVLTATEVINSAKELGANVDEFEAIVAGRIVEYYK